MTFLDMLHQTRESAIAELHTSFLAYFNQTHTATINSQEPVEKDITLLKELAKNYLQQGAFDELMELLNLLAEKQPAYYQTVYGFCIPILCRAYCYVQNKPQLKQLIEWVIDYPTEEGVDVFFNVLELFIVYQEQDLFRDLMDRKGQDLLASNKIHPSVFQEMYFMTLSDLMDDCYENYKTTGEIDIKTFLEGLKRYPAEPNEDIIQLLLSGLTYSIDDPTEMVDLLRNDFQMGSRVLMGYWFKYLKEVKAIPFQISALIWNAYVNYWYKPAEPASYAEIEAFLMFDARSFDDFIVDQDRHTSLNKKHIQAALIWGGVYFYDMMLALGLLKTQAHQDFINLANKMKSGFKLVNQDQFWQYDFLNRWHRADGETAEEQAENSTLVEQSYQKEMEPSNYSDASYFKLRKAIESLSTDDFTDFKFIDQAQKNTTAISQKKASSVSHKPRVKLGKTYGRNDVVKVEYVDGTQKEAKYKKVKKDIDLGRCKIV